MRPEVSEQRVDEYEDPDDLEHFFDAFHSAANGAVQAAVPRDDEAEQRFPGEGPAGDEEPGLRPSRESAQESRIDRGEGCEAEEREEV